MATPPPPPFTDPVQMAQALQGLATAAQGPYWQYWTYFQQVAQQAGVSAGQLALSLASMAGASTEASVAVQALSPVVGNGLAGAEAALITEGLVMTEAAVTGTSAIVAVEAAPVVAEVASSGGALAVVGETATAIGLWMGVDAGIAIYVGGAALGAAAVVVLGGIYMIGSSVFGTAEVTGAAITGNSVPHVCGDSDVPYTATWSWYQRIFGGGHSAFFEKDGYICYNSSYTTYLGGAFENYACDSDWTNCRRSDKEAAPITEVKPGDGRVTYYYNDGNSWGVRSPLN